MTTGWGVDPTYKTSTAKLKCGRQDCGSINILVGEEDFSHLGNEGLEFGELSFLFSPFLKDGYFSGASC